MKQIYFIALMMVMHFTTFAQLNNGGLNASFGVDADTKAGYLKYGTTTGAVTSDDWFSSATASGKNVIDTSNATYYRSLLQAGNNISFSKRMSTPYYTTVNGKLWMDALYSRDFIVNAVSTDTTTFSGGKKNGDDPASWGGVASSIPDKTDLVDAFAHMRRNGSNLNDSLWIFTGVSTVGVVGSRYFDIELYKNKVNYNNTTGSFNTAGPDAGHVQWKFDASGNITQTGDLIIAVSYTSGVPSVEVRIWVSKTTYNSVTPSLFGFGSSFDGSTNAFGYASILSKTGTTAFGSGIANLSATPAADTTYATPWGSHGLSGGLQWESQYQSLQFIEIGLNLTRMGLDPEMYSINAGMCQPAFASVFFKSRSSHSFTSNLQDFVGPYDFLQPALDYTISAPTLTCSNASGSIAVQNNTGNYFTWSTSNGNIMSTSASSIMVNKPGTYTVQTSLGEGCPVLRTDVITVSIDTSAPVASFYGSATANPNQFILHGGDTAASNYNTPFGGSQGLLWNWSGPNAFSSTVQDPTINNISGTYQLIVTEKRNGCTDTVSSNLNMVVLASGVVLKSEAVKNSVVLRWSMTDKQTSAFDIERSRDGVAFEKIGSVSVLAADAGSRFSFADNDLLTGNVSYRIRIVTTSGSSYYSNIVKLNKDAVFTFALAGNSPSSTPRLILNTKETVTTKVMVFNTAGQTAYTKQMVLQVGQNNIELPVRGMKDKLNIVAVYINNQLQFSGKLVF
ncbi:hypothetical protein [Niastella sp. OAS944]|uniref:hypothetical protein n=1 Tax=Niastella sp. OAS944 TaxID=2664089 RepID=UPI003493BD06|nr:hypothetical protein [Chitinophagaceae bacterium OAS944]